MLARVPKRYLAILVALWAAAAALVASLVLAGRNVALERAQRSTAGFAWILAGEIGGAMRIDSSPGRGTTVHLFFPVAPGSGEAR